MYRLDCQNHTTTTNQLFQVSTAMEYTCSQISWSDIPAERSTATQNTPRPSRRSSLSAGIGRLFPTVNRRNSVSGAITVTTTLIQRSEVRTDGGGSHHASTTFTAFSSLSSFPSTTTTVQTTITSRSRHHRRSLSSLDIVTAVSNTASSLASLFSRSRYHNYRIMC